MSPTLLLYKGYRFFFFSREETRMHVHASSAKGEAKFWLEPTIVLAVNYGLSPREVHRIQTIVEEHADDFRNRWREYFPS